MTFLNVIDYLSYTLSISVSSLENVSHILKALLNLTDANTFYSWLVAM